MRGSRFTLSAVAGDILLLIGFAALGRASHDESQGNALAEAAVVAAPFITGWVVIAPLFGTVALATIRDRSRTFRRIPAAWLVAGCLGLALRSFIQNRPVPPAFDAIALGFNLATLTAWRLVLCSLLARTEAP